MINSVSRAWLLILALSVGLMTASNVFAQEADSVEFSEAETRLWMTDQLNAVEQTMELVYEFQKSGSLEPGFTDEIRFRIEKINSDGTKAASVQFFTGERNFPVPPVNNATTNPILKVYLQGDVYEMNRLTDRDGESRERWRYFQRRIKFALADAAQTEPVTFEFDGKSYAGYQISFQPYINDPRRNLFERFAEKSYRFIISEDLPGYVYQIETLIPQEGKEKPLIKESLKLKQILPFSGKTEAGT